MFHASILLFSYHSGCYQHLDLIVASELLHSNPNTYLMITRNFFISKWLDTISENEASCEIFKKAAFLSWKHKRNLI